MADRRIILVGKAGNGKSYTGNSILGYNAFQSERSLVVVTKHCEVQRVSRANRTYSVCDTPGLLDADTKLINRLLEIQESVIKCGKPHAFLLVFSCLNRLTKDEEHTIVLLQIMFGGDIFRHSIVVFTRGSEFADNDAFRTFLSESKVLTDLINNCDNRVIKIENSTRNGLSQLLDLIETVSSNGKQKYEYKSFEEHRKVLNNHLQTYDGEENTAAEVNKICRDLSRVLSRQDWAKIIGTGIGAIGAVGGTIATVAIVAHRTGVFK